MNLRFPGQYLERETGLHQNWHREYDPMTGRYTQSDPIGLAGGSNPFAYVDANPLVYFDPTGLVTWTGSFAIGHRVQGVKLGRFRLRIPVLQRLEVVVEVTSECINGRQVDASVKIVNPESEDAKHWPLGAFAFGSVELDDNQPTASGYSLNGTFSLNYFGLIFGGGQLTLGRATGTFTANGYIFGGYSLHGISALQWRPTERECDCG